MAIRIVHQPSAASLGVPYAAGVGRGRDRRQKYMLDMFQRNRFQMNRLGALGGRGRGRAGGGVDAGGRWVENQDVLDAADRVQAARQAGEPAALADRRTLRQRKAQERRAARRGRLGIRSGFGSRFQGELLPEWQSAEDIAEQERERERQHDFDLIKAREDAKRAPFDRLTPQEQNAANQDIAGDIAAVPQEGDPVWTDAQQRQAKGIIESDKLSPAEKNEALKGILMDPKGEPEQSFAEAWKGKTELWDIDKNEPAEPGAVAGGNIKRMPIKGKGQDRQPDWEQYGKMQAAAQADKEAVDKLMIEDEKWEADRAAIEAQEDLIDDLEGKYQDAIEAENKPPPVGETYSDEQKAAMKAKKDIAERKWERAKARLSAMQDTPFEPTAGGGQAAPEMEAQESVRSLFEGKPPLVGQSPMDDAPQELPDGKVLFKGIIFERRRS